MRFFKSVLMAGAALALTAQAAWAGPDLVTFRYTAYGDNAAGMPPNGVGPYSGSINGGASSFDIYCVDAMNFVAPINQDFSAFRSRIGVDDLGSTRVGSLLGAAGYGGAEYMHYTYMAYIANGIRLGTYSSVADRAAAQLAMWWFSMDYPLGGWLYFNTEQPPILGQRTSGAIFDRLSEEAGGYPPLTCTGTYDWCAVVGDAIDNAFTRTANWDWANWVVYSDARWERESCWSRTGSTAQQNVVLTQDCYQEVIAYEVIPEPATMGLMALGLVGLGAAGLRRRRDDA
jgi:hypothetical protein